MLIKDFVADLPSTEAIANTRTRPGLPTATDNRSHPQEPAAPIPKSSSSAAHPADWFSTIDASASLSAAIRQRIGQTGSWLLATEQFAAWESGAKPLLWLCGPSGSGKTVISSVVVHHLRRSARRPNLFFFFDRTDARKKNGLESMLRSFLGQLLLHNPDRTRALAAKLPSACDNEPSREQLAQFAEDILAEVGPVDVVVDGIDDCVEQREVLLWLHKLMVSKSMRLFVSSKHDEPSEPCFMEKMHHASCIRLDAAATEEDAKAVAHWTLSNDPRFGRWQVRVPDAFSAQRGLLGGHQRDLCDEGFRKDVVNTIVKRADGIFRLVALQLDELARCDTIRAFKRTLATMPVDLSDMYARILSNIPTCRRRAVVRLLRFALFSDGTPLACAEATDALAVSLDMEPAFDPQDRLKDVEEITSLCPSMLELRGKERRVHVAHGSVREYLLSNPPQVDGYSDAFSESAAKAEMAKVCMAYLAAVAGLWNNAGGDAAQIPREVVERGFPFAGYAVRYWAAFARAEGVDEAVIADLLEFVTDEKTRALMACMAATGYPADSSVPSPFPTPLSLAAQFELPLAVSELLKTQPSAEDCTAALVRTCASSNTIIAALLLDNGADPNTSSGLPLKLACTRSSASPALVQLLLDAGADPSLPNPALSQILTTSNNLQILETLLVHPASTTINWTPALATVYEDGMLEVAKLFQSYGVHPSFKQCRSLLQIATRTGRPEVVALLLNNSAPALPAAAMSAALDEAFWKVVQTRRAEEPSAGHVQVLRLLVERSDELKTRFLRQLEGQVEVMGLPCFEAVLSSIPGIEGHGNLLVRACEGAFDHVAKVQLLLAHGMSARHNNSEALRAACRTGNVEVVALLLEQGADPYAEGPAPEEVAWEGCTNAFGIAGRDGKHDIMEILSRDQSWEVEKMRRVSFYVSQSRLRNEWRRDALGLGRAEA